MNSHLANYFIEAATLALTAKNIEAARKRASEAIEAKANQEALGRQNNTGVFGPNSVGAAERNVPKNIQKVDDKYLQQKGIDAHELKKEFIGKGDSIAHYDLYVDKDSGLLWIYPKGGKGEGIITYERIKTR